MIPRAWSPPAIAAALALATGFAGRAWGGWLLVVSGVLYVVTLLLLLRLLPFWQRLPRVEPMPDLMQPVREGQRWCDRCGNPTKRRGPCQQCHHLPVPPKRRHDPKKT